MHYYKNAELADLYGVSRRTVVNWIEQTQSGRIGLELQEEDGRFYVARNSKNQQILKGLVQGRRKFVNRKSYKITTPAPEFYKLFNENQILDIISNIDIHREIPIQYRYFNGGAEYWDEFAKKLYEEDSPNIITQTIRLLDSSASYIQELFAEYDYVNIVDIGPGNALPVKKFLTELHRVGKLKKYIAVDISQSMLDIVAHNIQEWFQGTVEFEGHVRDVNSESFLDVLALPNAADSEKTVNLVLLLGGTLDNMRVSEDGLKVILRSMSPRDILGYSDKIDSTSTRQQFDSLIEEDRGQKLSKRNKFLVDLLGIDESYYEVEVGFNQEQKYRFTQLRLKHALTIEFKLPKGTWVVDLKKDEALLVWRAWHRGASDITSYLYTNGFNPLLTAETPDHDYMLVLADLRKDGR